MHAASIPAPQHCRLGYVSSRACSQRDMILGSFLSRAEVLTGAVRAGHRLPSSFIKLVHGSLKEKTETVKICRPPAEWWYLLLMRHACLD
eukprot:2034493-Rhodomonas_salina.2